MSRSKNKAGRVVIINQAVNYLTINIANSFAERYERVEIITGSIHVQGEKLNSGITVCKINKWIVAPSWKKLYSYLFALGQIYFFLITRYRNYEVFFASVPPMGYLLNLITWHKFSMLIWDVYPDAFKVTGMTDSHPIYRIWSYLNKHSFKKASHIFTISQRMAVLLSKYIDIKKISVIPLWSIFHPNEIIPRSENPFLKLHNLEKKFIVQYSGNIGLSHRVEIMIELAELIQDAEQIIFQIIGRGPRSGYLRRMVCEKSLHNCQFLPFQSDEMFPNSLSAASLGVVILDDAVSNGSVPSKTYNLMSKGIPILYLASRDSELFDYSLKYQNGKCFSANELYKASQFIRELSEDQNLWKSFSEKSCQASRYFTRSNADLLVDSYINS